ncbi:DUF445 domain-containing protein [Fusobacterium sp. PH5-44]|uniref:DUF445 domain-containing protein n=1 Tax=unclassified Fusobacterium TaxID=2648384 RepID=UPI003D257487
MSSRLILLVVIGGIIGWITNFIAIRMLFRPYKPIGIGKFKIQGAIPKRRMELASSIGKVVEGELFSLKDIKDKLETIDLESKLTEIVNKIFEKKFEEIVLKNFPMLKLFLSGETLEKIKSIIVKIILDNKETIINAIMTSLENEINVKEMIEQKVSDFPMEKLEDLTNSLVKKELKHIELIGAILGAIIGFFQYLITLYV